MRTGRLPRWRYYVRRLVPVGILLSLCAGLAVATSAGYARLRFDQFQNVIDAVGGISMNFPMPLKDSLSGLNVAKTGCQLLNGFQALAVVRARHLEYYTNGQWSSDPLSDLSRIRRDQTFLRVLVSTIKTKGLNNPLRAE